MYDISGIVIGLCFWLYLLETLCDGGDGWHSTGEGGEHVTIGSHRAVKVPLLYEQSKQKIQRYHRLAITDLMFNNEQTR